MEPLSRSESAHSYQITHPLTAEEQAEEEKRLAILQIVKEAQDLRDNILKMPAAIQKYMFCHMSTEYLIELSKITNPDTEHLASIASSVRVFAVTEFNKKFNKEALLSNNKTKLLQVENKATTADILLSVELKDVEEELAPYIINHKDSQFVDAEATEARLKSLQEATRWLLLQNPNFYKYPFLVYVFCNYFKGEYIEGLRRIYNTRKLHLSDLNDALKKNKYFMLIAIQKDGNALQFAHEDLKKDRSIVFYATIENGKALQHAHEDFKNDREFVLFLVMNNGQALEYAHEDFKKDKALVLAAVSQNGSAFEFAHEDLRKDRKFVLAAVTASGCALQFAHEDFKKDTAIVFAAAKNNSHSFQYAHEDLRKDREIVCAVVREGGLALQYAHEDFRKDRKIVLPAVREYRRVFEFAHEDLRKDRKFALAVVKWDILALKYVHEDLKEDFAFMNEVREIERRRHAENFSDPFYDTFFLDFF